MYPKSGLRKYTKKLLHIPAISKTAISATSAFNGKDIRLKTRFEGSPPPRFDPSWEQPISKESFTPNIELDEEHEVDLFERGTKEAKFGKSYSNQVLIPKELKEVLSKLLENKPYIRQESINIFASLRSTVGYSTLYPELKKKSIPNKGTNPKVDKKSESKIEYRVQDEILDPFNLAYNEKETFAYIASRFCSTYAVQVNVLYEVHKLFPKFNPTTMYDFGAGPATSFWVANEVWGNDIIRKYTGIEVSNSMINIGYKILDELKAVMYTKINRDTFKYSEFMDFQSTQEKHNLTISSFALSELPNDSFRLQVIDNMWKLTSDVMVLVERGTPEGHRCIQLARDHILNNRTPENDYYVAAPCPHDFVCPLSIKGGWCHFYQKIIRPSFMMLAKNSKRNHENSGFSYVVLKRGGRPKFDEKIIHSHMDNHSHWSRIIESPNKGSNHIDIKSCSNKGDINAVTVTKKWGKQVYRDAKKARIGDRFPHKYFDDYQ